MEKVEEQLIKNDDATLNAVEHNEETTSNTTGNSSFLGSSNKFKSVEALSKAYENLEKEFTKKCQALNSLKSENEKPVSPLYERDDWQEKVGDFINNHKFAKFYTNEIAKVLSENEELSKKEDALNLAYSIVLENNFKSKEELINSGDFLEEFVYKNENIKNKIIEDYLLEVSSNKTVPLIGNIRGSGVIASPKYKPKSLKEASKYAEQILRK